MQLGCRAIQIVGVEKEDFGMVAQVGTGNFGIIPEEGRGTASGSNIYEIMNKHMKTHSKVIFQGSLGSDLS